MDAQYAETIVFRFIGYNLLGAAVRDVSGMLSGLSAASLKASESIGANMTKAGAIVAGVGSAMMLGAVLVGGAMVYAGAKAAEFQSQMILLHTQARVATSQLADLSTGVLGMAGAVGFAPTELAKALYFIESVGGGSYTTAHALDELKAAAMGAAVGHAQLDQTAKALAATMAVFPGMLPTQAMGQLDAIVGQGMMTMEDLVGALQTGVLATLQASGVSLADFGGALATMTDYAIPATQAANSLRMALYLMTAPTAASNKVLKEFGLTTAEVSSVSQEWTNKLEAAGIRHAQLADDLKKPGGIIIALQDLRSHLVAAGLDAQGQAEVIYKAFGGGKMGKAVITLYENIAGGARASDAELQKLGFTTQEIATLHDRLITKTALINAQTNLLGQNFAFITANDPTQMWKDFHSGVDAIIIALGTAFLPLLLSIVKYLQPLIEQFSRWALANKDLVKNVALGVVVFLALGGAALWLIGTIGMIAGAFVAIGALGIGATILPLILIFLAIGVAVAIVAFLVITHWKQIGAFFSALGVKAQEVKKAVLDWLITAKTKISEFIAGIGAWFSSLGTGVQRGLSAIGNWFNQLGTQTRAVWNNIISTVQAAAKEFFERPVYWIAYLVFYVPGLLYQLEQRAIVWATNMAIAAFNAGKDFLTNLWNWLQTAPGRFQNWVLTMEARLAAWAYNFTLSALNAGMQFVTNVVSWIMQLPGRVGAWLGNVVSAIAGWTTKLTNQASSTFGAFVGQIVATIMGTDWVGLGIKIITGILNGIKSMAGAIKNGVADTSAQIYSAFTKAFGIKSPSLLMETKVGAPLMQGIGKGMANELPSVQTKVSSMVTRIAASGSGTFVKPAQKTGNDSDQILKEIADGIAQLVAGKSSGPTSGIEALIYEINRRVEIGRRRGQKGYAA